MNIEYQFFRQKNIKPLSNFFNKYYKSSFNKNAVEWEFKKNPFGSPKILLGKINNKIIAVGVAIPIKVNFYNKIEKIYRIQNVLVDHNFRKKGIFQKILRNLDDYFIKKNIKTISFPNELSIKAFINNKWKKLLNINFLVKKIKDNLIPKTTYKYKRIKKFTKNHYNFFKKTKKLNYINIECNEDYLNWRFLTNKRSNFDCYEIFDNKKILAILVMKKYKIKNESSGQLCLQISKKKDLPKIINFCENYCLKHNLNYLNLWSNKYDKYFIKNFGFKQIFQKERFMIINNFKKQIAKKINLAMHYSDVF